MGSESWYLLIAHGARGYALRLCLCYCLTAQTRPFAVVTRLLHFRENKCTEYNKAIIYDNRREPKRK